LDQAGNQEARRTIQTAENTYQSQNPHIAAKKNRSGESGADDHKPNQSWKAAN